MKLATSLEKFTKEFSDCEIYMVPYVPLPLETLKDDLGFLFFYAMGYLKFLQDYGKQVKQLFQDNWIKYFFLYLGKDPIYYECGGPLNVLRQFFLMTEGPSKAFCQYDTLDSIKICHDKSALDKILTIHQYKNPLVQKYWRSRGDLDDTMVKVFTMYPREIDERHLTTQQKK